MIIENGGHDGGYKLIVNSEGEALTRAISEPEDRHLNQEHESVYSLPFEGIDPAGVDDYFFYIENTGTTNQAVTDIRIESSVIGTVEVHYVTGTPSFTAGVDVTPVNRHLGSNKTPTATIKTDTDTTGLINGGVMFWINCDTADTLYHLRTTSNIIIPPGQAVALMWDQATGILKGMVSLVDIVS
jgi:hypothetical protein